MPCTCMGGNVWFCTAKEQEGGLGAYTNIYDLTVSSVGYQHLFVFNTSLDPAYTHMFVELWLLWDQICDFVLLWPDGW